MCNLFGGTCNNWWWILILLLISGENGCGCDPCDNGCGNNGILWLILILLLSGSTGLGCGDNSCGSCSPCGNTTNTCGC